MSPDRCFKSDTIYVKYLKVFFGFDPKYNSVTAMIMQLGVPSFDTLMHNATVGLAIDCVATPTH